MIVPQRAEGSWKGSSRRSGSLTRNHRLASAHREWAESRGKFNQDLKVSDSEAVRQGWQKDYVRGTTLGGLRAEEHQTKLRLEDFADKE